MYDFDLYVNELSNMISGERIQHSFNVVDIAEKLSDIYGQDKEKIRIAALLHDIVKEMSTQEHIEILKNAGISIEKFENVSPKVLHGLAGSLYTRQKLGITDENILNAITYHTTGRENMSMFEKIIFIADFVSPERYWDDISYVRNLAENDIEKAVIYKLSKNMKACIDNSQAIHPDTFAAYNQAIYHLSKRNGKNQ